MRENNDHGKGGEKKSGRRKGRLAALILLGLAAALCIGLGSGFAALYGMSNYVSDEEVLRETVLAQGEAETVSVATITLGEDGTGEETGEMKEEADLPENEGLYNLLLVGVDRRDSSWSGNADSIILISADTRTETIHMVSFMRDLYADIPGYGVHKLNAACAYGGCPLLVRTLEENYGVNIDNYLCIDYGGMVALIDALGGVELEVSDEEASMANGLIRDMTTFLGGDPDEHYFPGGGTYQCDGFQATAYSRIRFVGNSDYERTERQRTVMTQMLQRVKEMDLKGLTKFALKVLPKLTHNIDAKTMLVQVARLPEYVRYEIEESRVPYDGYYYTDDELLIPDMEETRRRIRETVYGS